MELHEILQEYLDEIVSQMINQNYHLTLVKGGKDYPHLSEQSHFSHIINGIFGVSRLLSYFDEHDIYSIPEQQYRRLLSLYTAHDLHKTEEKLGGSEFSVPLGTVVQRVQELGLDQFAETTPEEHRAANVHARSSNKGDFLKAFADDPRLWTLVRIADAMASMTHAGDAGAVRTLERYMQDVCPEFALNYSLHYHELHDVRGVLTNLIHGITANVLQQKVKLFPILFFPNGVLYVGPKKIEDLTRDAYITYLSQNLLTEGLASVRAYDQANDGMRQRRYDFEKYVYLFADIKTLLQVTYYYITPRKPKAGAIEKEIQSFFANKKDIPLYQTPQEFIEGMQISLDEPTEFLELWSTVYYYLLVVDSIVRDVIDANDRLSWFMKTFSIQSELHEALQGFKPAFLNGGFGKYVLVIAYHYLKGQDFITRAAIQYPQAEILDRLRERLETAFKSCNIAEIRKKAARELGIEADLKHYLQEYLVLSWEPRLRLTNDAFSTYCKPKKKKTSNICTLCSRDAGYNMEMREGVFGDFVQGFANRNLPVKKQGKNMSWCPTCYLEFMLRSIAKLTPASGADKGKSKRLFFYLLPTFSFTPEHRRWLRKVLQPFEKSSELAVRDYGKDLPGHPRIWLEHRTFDEELIDNFLNIFEREAQRIEKRKEESGKEYVGERFYTSPLDQPNYYLFVWEKTAYGSTSDDAQIPTRSEMWAKAAFAAAMIAGLTSCKVVVTEKPYLPVADVTEIKSTILLDAPHPILRGMGSPSEATDDRLPERVGEASLVHLPGLLDLGASLWQINSGVNRRTKDKHIAKRLEKIAVEPLAGACFYKEYSRLNDDKSPQPIYTKACQTLLEYLGGNAMTLAEELAEQSMNLFLPLSKSGRGKAHSYELIFREALESFKTVYKKVVPSNPGLPVEPERIEEVKDLMSGRLLKGLERRQERQGGGGLINPWRKSLNAEIRVFVNLIVDRLFLERAHGSFTELNQMINPMADGIFYVVDTRLSDKWKAYKELKTAQKGGAKQ